MMDQDGRRARRDPAPFDCLGASDYWQWAIGKGSSLKKGLLLVLVLGLVGPFDTSPAAAKAPIGVHSGRGGKSRRPVTFRD